MKTIEVQRHSLFTRLVHWSIAITGIILALTGMELGGLYGVRILGEYVLATHMAVAFVFGGLWGLFTYYMFVEEWKWISFSRIPYSIKFFIAEAKAWIGIGPHVEDPRGYDPEKGEYVEKIIPTQVLVWWTYLALAILMGVTGLAMYYPDLFKPIVDLAGIIGGLFNPAGKCDGYTFLRALHRLGMFLFGMVMFMHMYAVVIFNVLPSMFTGKRKERVIKEQ
jgi:formate dehydrogenase subunit gamma